MTTDVDVMKLLKEHIQANLAAPRTPSDRSEGRQGEELPPTKALEEAGFRRQVDAMLERATEEA